MGRRKTDDEEEKLPQKVTDIDALKQNIKEAVYAFTQRWIPMPEFGMDCEVMDRRQLRDAMGLRATFEEGDPWPKAEKMLLELGFRWQWMGSVRVMCLKEKDGYAPDTGWEEAKEEAPDPEGEEGC